MRISYLWEVIVAFLKQIDAEVPQIFVHSSPYCAQKLIHF
jgi:hypothetical protein